MHPHGSIYQDPKDYFVSLSFDPVAGVLHLLLPGIACIQHFYRVLLHWGLSVAETIPYALDVVHTRQFPPTDPQGGYIYTLHTLLHGPGQLETLFFTIDPPSFELGM